MNSQVLPVLWFLAILAVIPLALWLLKRSPLGSGLASTQMRLVSILPLSPSQKLLTVEVGEGEDRRWLVLGVTAQQIQTLHVMPPQASLPATPAAAGFAMQLRQRMGGEGQGQGKGGGHAQ